jgi:hypothetical protein
MKDFVKWFGIIVLVAVIGFAFVGCDIDGDNPFVGTWSGGGLTVTCTKDTWSASMPSTPGWSRTGTYTHKDNIATLTQTGGNRPSSGVNYVATATISDNKMTIQPGAGIDEIGWVLTKQ